MLRVAKNYLKISAEVKQAFLEKKAVLALESTVISHGLPYPRNLELANELENITRANNAVPATIALLDGKVHIGLTAKQLEQVADPTTNAVKVSQRDIPYVLANKNLVGGTTVAATMYLAHQAGIRVFATGGIGGVHRGAEETFDISADLIELSRTPVAVVCAGVKSILDIGKTLEYMETHGVGVVVRGKSRAFPGFFVPETEFKAPWNCESLEEIAAVLECGKAMNMQGGTVIACPIPEELAADAKSIEKAIKKALKEAQEQKIASKEVTPFILKRVAELTKGSSVETNVGLLKNNVLVGAKLANILAAKELEEPQSRARAAAYSETVVEKPKPRVVCIGATNLDFEAHTDNLKDDGGSYPGIMRTRCGGVARNHADALTRLGIETTLVSAVGNDAYGETVMNLCAHMDMSALLRVNNVQTATYLSVALKGNVLYGITAIEPIVATITPEFIKTKEELIASADAVFVDGNLSVDALRTAITIAKEHNKFVWFDPADQSKVLKILEAECYSMIDAFSPNSNEFAEFLRFKRDTYSTPKEFNKLRFKIPREALSLTIIAQTKGANGVTWWHRSEGCRSKFDNTFLNAPLDPEQIVSVSGAGDCLNSGYLAAHLHGLPIEKCHKVADACARLSLLSLDAVPSTINPACLEV